MEELKYLKILFIVVFFDAALFKAFNVSHKVKMTLELRQNGLV